MSLNGETPDDARVIRARLNHNSPPTIELHADNLGQVTRAEKDRPETVIQVAAAPISEQGVVDHGQQYPAPRNALSCRREGCARPCRCPRGHADERPLRLMRREHCIG